MTSLYEGLIDGVLAGAVYALMAAGLTLIFGVMDIINIAQGVFVVLAAYLSYVLAAHFGVDLFVGILITMPALFLLGIAVDWAFIRRLPARDRTTMSILVTYAVAIIVEGVLSVIFGVNYVQLHGWYVQRSIHLLGFYLPDIYLFGFGMAVFLMAAIYFMLYRTRFGRSIRASLQNRQAARLIGINVDRVATLTFGIGVAVTAAGGMVFGATTAFNPNSGYDLISRLLSIVILGGLGSMAGAMVAAVSMLVVEDVVASVWSPLWSEVVFFAALVVVLTLRPQGLFGRSFSRAQ
ncbi:MAG TPA: branched-chain amino acid ABC transporter permease [Candidatus Dormibacteraeota bacterium]|nr:branched-chain amino acid ABC transporter permease [Candidatus Dormibacteraeota bacterium]